MIIEDIEAAIVCYEDTGDNTILEDHNIPCKITVQNNCLDIMEYQKSQHEDD